MNLAHAMPGVQNWMPVPLSLTCDVSARLAACTIDGNCHWQDFVVQRIFETGKHVDELTVGAVRQLIEKANADYHTALRRVG